MDELYNLYLIGYDMGQQIIFNIILVYSLHWKIKVGLLSFRWRWHPTVSFEIYWLGLPLVWRPVNNACACFTPSEQWWSLAHWSLVTLLVVQHSETFKIIGTGDGWLLDQHQVIATKVFNTKPLPELVFELSFAMYTLNKVSNIIHKENHVENNVCKLLHFQSGTSQFTYCEHWLM